MITTYPGKLNWPIWQKYLFRFFCIYFLLQIAPWTWIEYIPGGNYITQYYYPALDWCVNNSNNLFFHVRAELIPMNGSGDTSYGWAQLWLYLSLSMIGSFIWSLIGKTANQYNVLSYWLRVSIRYFLIINCFNYGFSKIFLLQMPFPTTSQLATPLGDFLPMRLSWMFMGSSPTYQFFAGLLEVIAGLLLLFRRTVTLGLFVAAGVFFNVMMMNMSYDIPVKLFSANLFLMSLFLLSFEWKRLVSFFLLNQPAAANDLYNIHFEKKWIRIACIILKLTFVLLAIILPLNDTRKFAKEFNAISSNKKFPIGIYSVKTFVRNKDTIPAFANDTLRWQDMIIDNKNSGSIKTNDTLYRMRYGRGYFIFSINEKSDSITFSKKAVTGDSIFLYQMKYSFADSNTIYLNGKLKSDSIFVALKKTYHHFQLTEKQFHWLSEYNR